MGPQHRGAGDRQRPEPFDDPALQVQEQAVGRERSPDAMVMRGCRAAGSRRTAGPRVDRATEHVDEQQHEGDRHHRGGDDRVRAADDVAQRPSQQDGVSAGDVVVMGVLSWRGLGCRRRRGRPPRASAVSRRSSTGGRQQRWRSARDPSAMMRPSWRIAIRSASCSASSRVLRGQQDRGPLPASRGRSPDLARPCGSEPGGGLVEEDHRRVADQAHRDVEPAPHAAGVGRHAPVRRLGEVERASRSSAIPARGPARCRRRATSTRFSRPVSTSSTAANCPVRLDDRPHRAACVTTSDRRRTPSPHRRRASPGPGRAWSCRRRWSPAGRRRCPARRPGRRRAARPGRRTTSSPADRDDCSPAPASSTALTRRALLSIHRLPVYASANVSANSTGSSPTTARTGVPSAAARSQRSAGRRTSARRSRRR